MMKKALAMKMIRVNPNLNQGQSPLAGTFKGRVSSPFVKSYFIDFSKRSDFAHNEQPKLFGLGN